MANKNKRKIRKKSDNKKLTQVINALEQIRKNEIVAENEVFDNDFKKIIERIKDDSFRLAVVGEFSSGKSTFLNALIGKDILKHGAQETTATVTEIYNDCSNKSATAIDVYFMDGRVKKNIPLNDITEVTATASKSYLVANEIERVVIRSNILENDSKVCFVDTPGLNGIADNHREKTIEQIKNAHACIYLMQVRGLGQSDIEFLKYICKYQHNIIFVQNFIDELKVLEGETPEEKIIEQTRIIEEKIAPLCDELKYEIVGVSSRKALISRSNEFNEYNGEKLSQELREKIYAESRFDDVINIIDKLMENNEKDKIKIKDAIMVAIDLLEQLKNVAFFEKEKGEKEWENSVDGINKKNYKNLIDLLQKNKESYLIKINNYVESEIASIKRECNKNLIDGLNNVKKNMEDILNIMDEIEVFETYVNKCLSDKMYDEISEVERKCRNQMNIRFENVICNAALRIRQYTGISSINPDIPDFEVVDNNINIEKFTDEDNEIDKARTQIEIKKKSLENEHKKRGEINVEKRRIDGEIAGNTVRISNNDRMKTMEVNKLGAMPGKETKYRNEVYQEERGGLGKILDFIVGKKEKIRKVPYSDYTKQNRWKKKKSDIESKYKEIESQIEDQNRRLEARKKEIISELEHIERMEERRQNEIKDMEKSLNEKVAYLAEQKEKAKEEYLSEVKHAILSDIDIYLHQNVEDILIDNYGIIVAENKKEILKIVNSLFEVSYKNRLKMLENIINENDETENIKASEQLIEKINKATKELEEYL